MGHLLLQASLSGLICQGPRQGKEYTFTLLDEWLPPIMPKEHEEAVAELMRRYFVSHGPATLKDFIYWAGLTVTDSKRALETVKENLHKETIEGQEYWMAANRPVLKKTSNVYLLAGFDELLLGYKDRTPTLAAAHTKKIVPHANGLFSPTIIIDGAVAGTWKRTIKKGAVLIELMPFEKPSSAITKNLGKAAKEYAHFLGLQAEIVS